jgi:hypothetical protein
MATDALTETVLDEAEAIVRANGYACSTTTPRASTHAAQSAQRCPPPGPASQALRPWLQFTNRRGRARRDGRAVGHRDVDRWAHARRARDGESCRLNGLPRQPTGTCRISVEQRR